MAEFTYEPINALWNELRSAHKRRSIAVRWLIAVIFGALLGLGVLALSRGMSMSLIIVFYAALFGLVASPLIGDLRMWMLGITIVDLSIQLDAYFGFEPALQTIGSISGYNVSLTTMALAALYGAWLAEFLIFKRTPERRPIVWAAGPLLIYLAGATVSGLLTPYETRFATYELFMLVQMFLLMIYIAGSIKTRSEVVFLLMFLIFGLLAQTIVIFAQRFLGMIMYPGVDRSRPGGSFISPNGAGGYLLAVITPLIALLLAKSPSNAMWIKLVNILAGATIAVALGALVLTQSRGSWLGFMIGAAVLLGLLWVRGWLPTKIIVGLVGVGIIAGAVLAPIVLSRLTTDDGGAAEARGPLNEIALEIFQEYPLIGVGTNNFGTAMFSYIPPNLGSEWIFTVHNKYLLILSETGIVGFTGWASFLVLTLYRAWRVWMRRDPFLSVIALGIGGALLGHYVHLAGDIFNFRPMVQLVWTYSALLFAMDRIIMAERTAAPSPAMAQTQAPLLPAASG